MGEGFGEKKIRNQRDKRPPSRSGRLNGSFRDAMPSLYETYSAEDFAQDAFFRQWVFAPDPPAETFWRDFLRTHPHQQANLTRARAFLLAVERTHEWPTGEQADRMWTNIRQRTAEPESEETEAMPPHRFWLGWGYWGAAAAVTLLLGVGWMLFRPGASDPAYRERVAHSALRLVETANATGKPLTISLSDHSTVVLQPGSRLSYPPRFGPEKREVYLSGEGFFEVTHNPARPFVVYAHELATKVLGTSFRVKALGNEVVVEVRTGKVSVFSTKNDAAAARAADHVLAGVVLTPNQRVVFSREDDRLTKGLVAAPQLLPASDRVASDRVAPDGVPRFEFDDTPAPRVFAELEAAYGIDIVFDEAALARCPLTASLTDQSLYQKLDIVCKALEASYQVIDGQIVIDGKGCR